ncbi:MAG: hypothetical protein Q8P18_29405 [Pseudomonadota bacterium]|nr:hypothetical protein [Pseudomonadota bacterium]
MLLFLLLGCAPVDPPPAVATRSATCVSAPAVTWENWGHGFFLTWCASCHAASTPDRRGAPEGVDFETEADLARWSDRIRARTLDEHTMPVGGGLYDADLALLEVLLTCSR